MSDLIDPSWDAQKQASDGVLGRAPLMFDPWLISDSLTLKALAANLDWSFDRLPLNRQRARKKRDRENVEMILHAVFANLAYAVKTGQSPPIVGVSLRAAKQKKSRYDRSGFAALPAVLEAVGSYDERQLFRLDKSYKKGVASQIVGGAEFVALVQKLIPDLSKFRYERGGEVIWLTRTQRNFVEGTKVSEPVEYEDTPETTAYRDQVRRLNAFLSTAQIGFENDGGPTIVTAWRDQTRQFKIVGDQLPAFDLCGRLFGGWWQSLAKERRSNIRIAGEEVADLDFDNMFVRLAYLRSGFEPPDGDLYSGIRGFEGPQWRDGLKKVINALLFRATPLVRLPKIEREALPHGTTGSEIRGAILTAHPKLAGVFEHGHGLRLMFTESQILMAALLRLVDSGVPALGMHDGLMVARSKVDVTIKAMQDAAEEVVGFRLPISRKS